MAKRDLYSLTKNGAGHVVSIEAKAIAATTAGTAVDMKDYESLICLCNHGVCTDGKYLVSLQDSDDNSTFATVAAADLQGSFTVVNAAADQVEEVVGYIGDKRYVKAVITETSAGTTGLITSICLLRGHPRHLGLNLMA